MKTYFRKNSSLFTASLILGIFFSAGSAFIALFLQDIVDTALSGNLNQFYHTLGMSAIYVLALSLMNYLYSRCSKKLMQRILNQLRADLFNGIFRTDRQDFYAVNSADYLSMLNNDTRLVEEHYLAPLLIIIQQSVVFICALGIMLYLSPLVTLCLFLTMILMIIIPALFQKRLQTEQAAHSSSLSAFTIKSKDLLSGAEVIRSFRMLQHIQAAWQRTNDHLTASRYAADSIYALIESLSVMLGAFVQFSVIFVSAFLIIRGHLTAGTLTALMQLSGSVTIPVQTLSENLPKIQGIKPVFERLFKIINYENNSSSGHADPVFQKTLSVHNLSFSYTGNKSVLNDISLSLQKNKKYAIVGKSGCGKTTLMNLLSGCYSDYEGEICFDDQELRFLNLEKLNEMTAIVHQDVFLFDESVRDNICLHHSYTEDQIQNALSLSGIDLFLHDECSLDIPVGENGSLLSGGQKQRIAVARALIGQKPILILDEGTSALDQATAEDIEQRLLHMNELTLFTITHHLNEALLRRYDAIIYMDEGRVMETGHFDELMRNKSFFSEYLLHF